MKTPPPKCKGCYKPAVMADAGILRSIPYWYCRTCKAELDDWGREVPVKKSEGLAELEDYLSGEVGRFEHEYVGQWENEKDRQISIYDPFLKRNRKVSVSDLNKRFMSPVLEEEEDDDEILGYWEPGILPETF